MKSTGLTLGKFAPLHKGHEFMLESALRQVDDLICLIYDCPNTTNVPLPIRASWIKRLFPKIEIVEVWDGPLQVGNTPEIKKMHEDFILKLLNGRHITHFFSSEFYGEHMSIALNAKNCIIDDNRTMFPISGTEVRNNPFNCRKYINPLVYSDLISKVVFLGAPSTGKTTIAEKLSIEFNTVWMPEYGREYWEENQIERRLSLEQLVEIAEGHIIREDNLIMEANKYIFCDTNALTTNSFSQYYHASSDKKLIEYANNCAMRYDIVFLCDTDIPYDDTWDRSGDANRLDFQKQIEKDLINRNIPFIKLSGDLNTRINKVKDVLTNFEKY